MINEKIGYAIKALNNQMKRYMSIGRDDDPEEAHLTGMQHAVIGLIGHREEVFQRDIESAFHIRRSTATGILQLLERNGYITRTSVAHDARLKKITLTKRGEDAFHQAIEAIDQMEAIMRDGISEEDLSCFFRVMNKVQENLQRMS